MAMSKKEREQFAALETKFRMTAALRWTDAVPFDLMPPAPGSADGEISGFIFNTYNLKVEPAWSNSVIHGRGYASEAEHRATRGSASQRGIAMHSTRLRALRALRHSLEVEAAARLMEVDRMIEAEEDATRTGDFDADA